MNNKKTNSAVGPCVQCAVLMWILKRMEIDVDTPPTCEVGIEEDVRQMKSRKEVLFMLDINASTYTRWVKQGILAPRIVGFRHFYTDADLQRALQESIRKGKR